MKVKNKEHSRQNIKTQENKSVRICLEDWE